MKDVTVANTSWKLVAAMAGDAERTKSEVALLVERMGWRGVDVCGTMR